MTSVIRRREFIAGLGAGIGAGLIASPAVVRAEGPVVIRAGADTPRQLDGDSVGPGRELTMECVHGRLLVRVPR